MQFAWFYLISQSQVHDLRNILHQQCVVAVQEVAGNSTKLSQLGKHAVMPLSTPQVDNEDDESVVSGAVPMHARAITPTTLRAGSA